MAFDAASGARIVLTAPLTEVIDHAGYFIQMSMASLPIWLEGILDRKYPKWRELEYNADGTARYMPAGLRVLEECLLRRFPAHDVVCCYPADVHRFIGPQTRVVAVSTHNPLGVTFAAGVYTSIFGTSKQTINAHYARELFKQLKSSPHRGHFRVIVGGSGGWQIVQTDTWLELGVDCVVEGRAESEQTLELFDQALRGEPLPRQIDVAHPTTREAIVFPDKRTTFGVVEMTVGCGRRCQFCLPDLNPQIDMPKEKILGAVRANVRDGNKQISARHRRHVHLGAGAHRDAVLLPEPRGAARPVRRRGEYARRRAARVQPRDDRAGGGRPRADRGADRPTLDKSPLHLGFLSTHKTHKAIAPLIGLETGSVRMAKQIMPSKAVPFPIEEWPSVVVRGLEILNRNNWFPAMTLMIGNPGETDEDTRETIDLICEVERRGLFAFFIPSIFTPLHDTRMEAKTGVTETRQLTPLQWQLMMKCWKMNLRPGQQSWWGPTAWRIGAIGLWAWKLRTLNGPGFTWPLLMFANALPERLMAKMGKLHAPRPVRIKTRSELLETIKPHQRKFIRRDTGDIPDGFLDGAEQPQVGDPLPRGTSRRPGRELHAALRRDPHRKARHHAERARWPSAGSASGKPGETIRSHLRGRAGTAFSCVDLRPAAPPRPCGPWRSTPVLRPGNPRFPSDTPRNSPEVTALRIPTPNRRMASHGEDTLHAGRHANRAMNAARDLPGRARGRHGHGGARSGRGGRSRHPDFKAGDLALGDCGWQEYAALPGASLMKQPHVTPLSNLLSV